MEFDYDDDSNVLGVDPGLALAVTQAILADPSSANDLIHERMRDGREDPFPNGTTISDRRYLVEQIKCLIADNSPHLRDERNQLLVDVLERALRNGTKAALSIDNAVLAIRDLAADIRRQRDLAQHCFEALGATKPQVERFVKLLDGQKPSEQWPRLQTGFGDAVDRHHRRAGELAMQLLPDEDERV